MTDKEEQLFKERFVKLSNLEKSGIEAYASTVERTATISEIIEEFARYKRNKKAISLAGRIRAIRAHGGLIFGNLDDGSGSIQFMLKEDEVGKAKFSGFGRIFDVGDFIQIQGGIIETKRGEKTLLVAAYKMLAKSLRALPEKHHGLVDTELKLRKRYLDILVNPDAKEIFIKKAKFWKAMRSFLVEKGFLELEMPVFENTPGGAEAEPFVVHHKALGRDFYLRISLELPLKKMLVAGFEKVFEIGRIFRNEGVSTEHLQDYTQMEFYWAYANFGDLMEFAREMYQHTIKETFGTLKLKHQNETINWGGKWPQLDYFQVFKKYTGIDLKDANEAQLKKYAEAKKIHYEKYAKKGRLIDLIFKKTIRILPEVSMQPVFLINQPVEIEPLAKRVPGKPQMVQRVQILACGTELGKGFGELNDPIDQRARFEEQMKLREAGDREAQMIDEDYLEAMEYGMPPNVGFGLSERLFAVLMDKSVRETVVFPLMKEK